jgi:hypothetical protein
MLHAMRDCDSVLINAAVERIRRILTDATGYGSYIQTNAALGRSPVWYNQTSSGIPINTLYAVSELASPSASMSRILTTGNHETLYVLGWLDLSKGPLVLHVPDMNGRYYSVQFTDPSDGADFAYVGTRTTGTQAGDSLITGPGWQGSVPQGMKQISSPNNSVLVLGRALVESDSDVATVYALTKQIQLKQLSQWKPGQ